MNLFRLYDKSFCALKYMFIYLDIFKYYILCFTRQVDFF